MSQLKRNVVANYVGQGWRALMSLAFIPLYIDFIGMESYGLIGVFGVMQAWLALLSMGMSPTLNREMARYAAGVHTPQSIHNLLRSFEIICVGLALFVIALIWLGSNYLATSWFKVEALPVETVETALLCMSFVMALRFLEGIYQGSLFGLQRQVWFNVASIFLASLQSIGAICILSWWSPTIQAFFLWQAFVSLLSVIVFFIGVHRALEKPPSHPSFSRKALSDVWGFAGGMLGITILSLLLTQVDKIILTRVLTLKSFGFYALATTVTGVILMAVIPLNLALYPRMVELVTKKTEEQLSALYHVGTQIVVVLIGPATLLLVFFSDGILFMWSGKMELVLHVAPIISVLVVGTFFNGLMFVPYHLQLAYGWTSLSIKMNVAAVCLLGSANLYFTPIYGPIGAAWIWVVLNVGYITIGIYLMHRRLIPEEKWNWYLFDIILPLSGSLLVISIAWFLRPSGYESRLDWFLFLLLTGGFGTLASFLFARRLVDKFQPYLRRVLRSSFDERG